MWSRTDPPPYSRRCCFQSLSHLHPVAPQCPGSARLNGHCLTCRAVTSGPHSPSLATAGSPKLWGEDRKGPVTEDMGWVDARHHCPSCASALSCPHPFPTLLGNLSRSFPCPPNPRISSLLQEAADLPDSHYFVIFRWNRGTTSCWLCDPESVTSLCLCFPICEMDLVGEELWGLNKIMCFKSIAQRWAPFLPLPTEPLPRGSCPVQPACPLHCFPRGLLPPLSLCRG